MDTVANQRNQVVLHGNIKQRIKPFNISRNLLLPIFFFLKSVITFLRDKPGLYALIVKAKVKSIAILRYWNSTNWANITPLTTLCT